MVHAIQQCKSKQRDAFVEDKAFGHVTSQNKQSKQRPKEQKFTKPP